MKDANAAIAPLGVSIGPIQVESARKFGLCSNYSQKLDECPLARKAKFLQVLGCSDFR